MITVEEQLITVKVGQSIDWRIDRFKKGSKTDVQRPRTAQGLVGAGTIF